MQPENVTKLFPVPLAGKVACKAVRGAHKGFTLIELLVVVLIIGILAAVAVPQYKLAVAKSSYTQAITLGTHLYHAEQIYKLANGTMTPDLDKLDISLPIYDSSTKKAYNSNKKTVACYQGIDPQILCDITTLKTTVTWWGFSNGTACLFKSTQQNADFAEKICKSFCISAFDETSWPGYKSCFITKK